ncbi:hypothetical protein ACG7TL_005487 [Trametes sanguinea]
MSSPPSAEALLRQLSRISQEQRWPVEWTPRFVGNELSEQQCIRIVDIASAILRSRAPFAQSIGSRLEFLEVKVIQREEDGKIHLRFTFEVDTTPGPYTYHVIIQFRIPYYVAYLVLVLHRHA